MVQRLVDNRGTRAFGDRISSAQNPRRPRVVAFECRCGGERTQSVDERELVMEASDPREAFARQCDRAIRVFAPHGQDGAKIQR